MILLLLYTALTIWQPLSDLDTLPEQFGAARLVFLLRLLILFLMLLVTPIAVSARNIQLRLQADAGQGEVMDAYLRLHDGALQLELALAHLQNGVNPYAATYDHPLMSIWDPAIGVNPATEHLIYLPGLLLASLPFQWVGTAVLGFYDQRLLYLLAFVLVVLLLPLTVIRPTYKLALIIGVALNPWLAQPVAWGMNDILVVLCLLVMGLLLWKKHPLWAAVVLALACTMKQSAWLFVPFFLLAVYLAARPEKRWREVATAVLLIGGIMALIIGPFALWNLPAFMDDTFAYASGTAVSLNYPIRGYTIGRLLVLLGQVESDLDYYPFWMWQVVIGLPVLVLSLYYQWRQRTIAAMFLAASLFIFTLGFVSRYFQDNYVGFVITLAFWGLFPTFAGKEIGD
ncbi:MAG TPA: glycosyltransferase 87 family protein [Chloroflexota bacterium]|nr:glycosyltransferase 87 family protein [Chloroflexota bacterium]